MMWVFKTPSLAEADACADTRGWSQRQYLLMEIVLKCM